MFFNTKIPNLKQLLKPSFLLLTLTALLFTSCQKEASTQFEGKIASTTPTNKKEEVAAAAKQIAAFLDNRKLTRKSELLQMSRTTIEKEQGRNNDPVLKTLGALASNPDYQSNKELVLRMINPDDFECGRTIFDDYLDEVVPALIDEVGIELLIELIPFMVNIPEEEAIYIDNTRGGDYFGADGEYTSTITKNFVRLQTFWDIPRDIQLADMHGAVFKDEAVVAEILELLYGFFDEDGNFTPITPEEALEFAGYLKVVFGAEAFQDYKHPLFTFNAFALSGFPEFGVGKKIVMGDGVLAPYEQNSFRTIAERSALAHEYGHQIQYANGYFDDFDGTAAALRRMELMADAYAAYYLAHQSGAFLERGLISRYAKSARAVGDCAFDNPNFHHGTPNQREKAADFGARVAVETRDFRKTILSSQEFFELFEAELPQIIAPDAN